ncbi:hypothetical protein PHY01_47570 [Pseudonocardia hydrocarbonoxydans]|uniref:Translation initiation factor n=1 Tax=Pseudonocardia hydrocarbonoxydans TaxID=76726 RepID=A0A4Y3WUM3_9PSEU|nr:DUF6319 family protein [Pseudonocardia hydrocarbonoxydans]GEC22474.1 hypothetical protein PHY01_47570 [Pseudonocardia hydrocarbonoxydans]
MTAAGALTEQDVAAVRKATAAGQPVTVWFTAAAVGVPAGRSAKVSAVGDPADGDFIQVRPAGSRDTMFCSPNELTRTRPPRGAAASAAAGRPEAKRATASASSASPAAARAVPSAPVAVPGPSPAATEAPPAPGPKPAARTGTARGRAARPAGMTVTLEVTVGGEWSVEVRSGTKRVVPAMPVQAADVAAAARSLPSAVAEAIEASLERARQQQRDRVERLRSELDAAQRVLEQLDV